MELNFGSGEYCNMALEWGFVKKTVQIRDGRAETLREGGVTRNC